MPTLALVLAIATALASLPLATYLDDRETRKRRMRVLQARLDNSRISISTKTPGSIYHA